MGSMEFEVIGSGFLSENLEEAAKKFPYSTEKILKKEARRIAKDLKNRVDEEAVGHHYGESKYPLAKSFRQGKVIKSGEGYKVAVTSNAPHYHFYEEGHVIVTHNRKNKNGSGKKGTGKVVGKSVARKTVARYMAKRAEYAELIGQELLDEILKDAGLD